MYAPVTPSSGTVTPTPPQPTSRRDSVPVIPRSPLDASESRLPAPNRHFSMHSLDNVRPSQSYGNLHSYYTSQRAGQRTPDDDLSMLQMKRRVPLGKQEYASAGSSSTGSASSSLILDTSVATEHSMTFSEVMDDAYLNRRRRFRMGSASFEGLVGINESDMTPRAPKTAGIIGMQNKPSQTQTFDPFATSFASVTEQRRLREQRSRGDSNSVTQAESPSPRSATFSLFSSESTQTNPTTTSSPESSPSKTAKPFVPTSKIAPIGTKRSSGSLNTDASETKLPGQTPTPQPVATALPAPLAETDKWNMFSGGWCVSLGGNNTNGTNPADGYRGRTATSDSSQKRIWENNNSKGLGMTVGSGSVDVWG
jgi:hypothetical protein